MTMFDQMTSINVADQDEDLVSLIKCVNWNKNSIVNIGDGEEQKDPLSLSLNLLNCLVFLTEEDKQLPIMVGCWSDQPNIGPSPSSSKTGVSDCSINFTDQAAN